MKNKVVFYLREKATASFYKLIDIKMIYDEKYIHKTSYMCCALNKMSNV